MKILNVEQNSDAWFDARRGKISGTILGDVYSKRGGRKIGFYQVIAERLGLDPDDENRMDRGLRLEDEAAELFAAKTGKEPIKAGICVSWFSDDVINSPDRLIKNGKSKKYTEALEIKCLSPARHLQAVIENKVPSEFESQMVQYFVVNEHLETLYFLFYDPRVPSVPYHVIEVNYEDVAGKVEFFKTWQLDTLKEIETIIEELTF